MRATILGALTGLAIITVLVGFLVVGHKIDVRNTKHNLDSLHERAGRFCGDVPWHAFAESLGGFGNNRNWVIICDDGRQFPGGSVR